MKARINEQKKQDLNEEVEAEDCGKNSERLNGANVSSSLGFEKGEEPCSLSFDDVLLENLSLIQSAKERCHIIEMINSVEHCMAIKNPGTVRLHNYALLESGNIDRFMMFIERSYGGLHYD